MKNYACCLALLTGMFLCILIGSGCRAVNSGLVTRQGANVYSWGSVSDRNELILGVDDSRTQHPKGEQVDGFRLNIYPYWPSQADYPVSLTGFECGLFNHSRLRDAGQLGLVNAADHSEGMQFGLVNLSSQSDILQFGIVNYLENGFLPYMPFVNWSDSQ